MERIVHNLHTHKHYSPNCHQNPSQESFEPLIHSPDVSLQQLFLIFADLHSQQASDNSQGEQQLANVFTAALLNHISSLHASQNLQQNACNPPVVSDTQTGCDSKTTAGKFYERSLFFLILKSCNYIVVCICLINFLIFIIKCAFFSKKCIL